ncbi:MAG: nucleoside hydrolase [Candidatus Omnitrophica bacterium]|nr:nucleoside hydrolase [Candidatus Omnitrophota bacterium]
MRRVLIDSDPGIDDALAMVLALGEPKKIDVTAICSTYGNVSLAQTKRNLLKVLSFFNKSPLIGSGSSKPIRGKAPLARYVHGKDGLGDLSFPAAGRKGRVVFKDGVDLIIKLALSHKIDTIIATGPLTDLARAIRKNPRFLENLDEIVIMGGAVFVKGNATPYAEFNFYCDPEAARVVLNSPVKKRLVSLDVTQETLLTNKLLSPLKEKNSDFSEFICSFAEYSIFSNEKRGFFGAPMHDPLAVGLTIDKKLGKYRPLRLDIETKGRKRGKVLLKKGMPNAMFCKKVDTKGFFDLFIGILLRLVTSKERERYAIERIVRTHS